MIHDLAEADVPRVERITEVCVVGAGVAGLFLAHVLHGHGLRVAVVEAGGMASLPPRDYGVECLQLGTTYRGAEAGRNFGLGGTSAIWGGQLIRPSRSDMEERSEVHSGGWPIRSAELDGHYERVRRQLRLSESANGGDPEVCLEHYPELQQLSSDFTLRLSEWLPFGARNFAKLFRNEVEGKSGLEVWLNASVVALQSNGDSHRIRRVVARSAGGRTLSVEAGFVVICAGALESTRLLLEYDEASGGTITRDGAPLGRYFADHLSVTSGRFWCLDWNRYNKATAPIFVRGAMRTPRLELTRAVQERYQLPSAFGHFTFVTHGDTGFDLVRACLQKRQAKDERLRKPYRMMGQVVNDLYALAYWRWHHRQLWIPRRADLLLQIDIEQIPNWGSRVFLGEKRDPLGRKVLAIDWRIREDDVRVVCKVGELLRDAWRSGPLQNVAELTPTPPENLEAIESLYDVYHPTGTLRMGLKPEDSVVDPNLRLWAANNVYVSSTAVLPTTGSANPTFAQLALTARLGDHLVKVANKPTVLVAAEAAR
ncbi:MAG TPA: GMC oxidoreductase [Candidatus Bathyarchaeia archaeon]|jgi:choline dehydrogenase-like flavoprotein|nr:GMC oxidoreductase [Candidatus Bathyarchaeia archaeon]